MDFTNKLIEDYLREDVVEFPKEILKSVTDLRGTPSYGKADYRCPECGSRDVKALSSESNADPAEAIDGSGTGSVYCKDTYCYCNECGTHFKHTVCTTTTISSEVIPVAQFYFCYDVVIDPTKQTIYSGNRDEIYEAFCNDCETLFNKHGVYWNNIDEDKNGNFSVDGLIYPDDDGTGHELISSIISFAKEEPPINNLEKILTDALNKDNNLDKVITFLKDRDKLKEIDEAGQFYTEFILENVSVDNDACFVSLSIGSSVNSDADGIIL